TRARPARTARTAARTGRAGAGSGAGPLVAATVFLVAMCLRPALTSVGPLLPRIGAAEGLGETMQGLLGALPLLAFAAVSPLVHRLSGRLGVDRSVLVALLVLTVATVGRSWSGPLGLWVGTWVIGGAIAIGNVLVPVIVRRDYAGHVPGATGLYSACLVIAAGVASAVAVPVAEATDWRVSLAVWAIPSLVVAGAWLPRTFVGPPASVGADLVGPGPVGPGPVAGESAYPPEDPEPAPDPGPADPEAVGPESAGPPAYPSVVPEPATSIWRQGTAWLVTAFMGLQAASFYILVTWLPTVEDSMGVSSRTAGIHLLLYQGIGIVGGLTIPILLRRGTTEVTGCVVASLPTLVAVVGLLLAPALVVLWVCIAGLGQGAALVTALTLVGIRGRSHHDTARLSGMAQSVGYLLAAGGPVTAGYLAQRTGGWRATLLLVTALAVVQIVVAVPVGRDRMP
ncbi:MFS transporter, partial [Nostocoides japonicum]|uniref:MFS transporter n=1 Tax=Nostocoides japonicum TaxID=99481 RepID=UPI0019107B68